MKKQKTVIHNQEKKAVNKTEPDPEITQMTD